LKERNPKWINDDYVKFIRMAEDLIANNPSGGVLGFITNHGYLDNPTFRGMRWRLLKTFDKIWVVDLHGNTKKKEISPDGSLDKNVFDIQQGVALIIAVRKGAGGELAEVYHGEMWGSRTAKYDKLWTATAAGASPVSLPKKPPQYPFVPRNDKLEEIYGKGVAINDLLPVNSVGIVTARDALTIDMDREVLWARVEDFTRLHPEVLRRKYSLGEDAQDWSVASAKADVQEHFGREFLVRIAYRPLDVRWTYFTGTSRGFHCRPREEVMRHLAEHPNVALMIPKQTKDEVGGLVNDGVAGHKAFSGFDITSNFPLYLYPDVKAEQADAFGSTNRTLNLNLKLYTAICEAAGIDPADQAGPDDDFRAATGDRRPSEVKVFDYVYGVLHAPVYRETFAEFLKIDFPCIPYPPSREVFHNVSAKGEQLRRLHLMEARAIGDTPYPYHGDGDDVVASGYPKFDSGRVYINKDQYFSDVPAPSWTLHIGGYQPAQKWLKDRRGRSLSWEDIGHYQKIVKILAETDRIMKKIELPLHDASRDNAP
ncbi:MAG TPA: type ISP restriction/modification enzyme, partial [Allosphingosinicella sp.]